MTDPSAASAATVTTAPPSASDPMPPAQLAAVVAATLGYYALRDAVSTPWLRRTGQAVVLVGTAAPFAVAAFRSSHSEEARKEVSENLAKAKENWREQSPVGQVRTALMIGGPFLGMATVIGFLTEKFDAVGESVVRKVGGRLPVVGGLCRRVPNTVNGLLQSAAAVGVNTVQSRRQAGRAGDGKA
ncbi:MAG TPA: hypothetical protein H9870_09660 [Candidatus Corynebacterium avicola]|uniref:Uncharacterized protein n=1 Tax=Candidatus Corynebacterium avicola TaxID=2838527 RepID=A0A9D1RSC5_9CORY|nr:hypothetical protein [Candidatus Corynebacterium avicola]